MTSFAVAFETQKCEDCGVVNDVRLMPNYCHQAPIYKHMEKASRYHPEGY